MTHITKHITKYEMLTLVSMFTAAVILITISTFKVAHVPVFEGLLYFCLMSMIWGMIGSLFDLFTANLKGKVDTLEIAVANLAVDVSILEDNITILEDKITILSNERKEKKKSTKKRM